MKFPVGGESLLRDIDAITRQLTASQESNKALDESVPEGSHNTSFTPNSRLLPAPLLDELLSKAEHFRCVITKESGLVESTSNGNPNFKDRNLKALWDSCCKVWNLCVLRQNYVQLEHLEKTTLDANKEAAKQTALLRQLACDLAALLPEAVLTEDQVRNKLIFSLRAGEAWVALDEPEQAEVMRFKNLWNLSQFEASRQLVADCSRLSRDGSLCLQLAQELLEQSASRLSTDAEGTSRAAETAMESVQYLNCTYELVSHASDCLAEVCSSRGGSEEAIAVDDKKVTSILEYCRDETLMWLAQAHILCGDGSAASNCLGTLQQLDSPAARDPAWACLAINAALIHGKVQEATQELIGLVAHDAATEKMCLELVSRLLNAGAPVSSLQAAVTILQDRFPLRPHITVTFVALVLKDAEKKANQQEANALLLELLGSESCGPAVFIKGGRSSSEVGVDNPDQDRENLRADCLQLLWNVGVQHFNAKRWDATASAFKASHVWALEFLDQSEVLESRMLKAGGEDKKTVQGASDGVNKSGLASTAFIKMKVFLETGDDEGALKEIHKIAHCSEVSKCMLEVACQEAVSKGAYMVAKEALLHLHKQMVADMDSATPGEHASELGKSTLLRVLAKLPARRQSPRVACQEAVSMGAYMVAKEALLHLHKQMVADMDSATPGEHASELGKSTLLRVLAKCVACQEAVSKGAYMVAKEALLQLHKQMVADMDSASHGEHASELGEATVTIASELSEATVLRVLAKCVLEEFGSGDKKAGQAPKAVDSDDIVSAGLTRRQFHKDMANVFKTAADRLNKTGYPNFFKEDPACGKYAGLEWLSYSAFNAGMAAGTADHS
eukprot:gene14782-20832_t